MATLPALRPCFGCGNNTRFSLEDGRAFCTNCMDLKNRIAQEQKEYSYAVRMPSNCKGSALCFDSAIPGSHFCRYHKDS